MSDWITDRRPTAKDAYDDYVWVTTEHGYVLRQRWDQVGQRPWLPSARPDPYMKPKRYKVKSAEDIGLAAPAGYLCVYDTLMGFKVSSWLYSREAAERIAAIYEEVMP